MSFDSLSLSSASKTPKDSDGGYVSAIHEMAAGFVEPFHAELNGTRQLFGVQIENAEVGEQTLAHSVGTSVGNASLYISSNLLFGRFLGVRTASLVTGGLLGFVAPVQSEQGLPERFIQGSVGALTSAALAFNPKSLSPGLKMGKSVGSVDTLGAGLKNTLTASAVAGIISTEGDALIRTGKHASPSELLSGAGIWAATGAVFHGTGNVLHNAAIYRSQFHEFKKPRTATFSDGSRIDYAHTLLSGGRFKLSANPDAEASGELVRKLSDMVRIGNEHRSFTLRNRSVDDLFKAERVHNIVFATDAEAMLAHVPSGSKFLGVGSTALTLETTSGKAVRIQPCGTSMRADIPEMLKPTKVNQGSSGRHEYWQVEELPIARNKPVSDEDYLDLLIAARSRGVGIYDAKRANTGRLEDGRYVFVDPGAVGAYPQKLKDGMTGPASRSIEDIALYLDVHPDTLSRWLTGARH